MPNTNLEIKNIQFKRGKKAILEEKLVAELLGVPSSGEPIYETDTGKLKIGDGTTAYCELPYLCGDPTDLNDAIATITNEVKATVYTKTEVEAIKATLEGAVKTNTDNIAVLSKAVGNAKNGDIAATGIFATLEAVQAQVNTVNSTVSTLQDKVNANSDTLAGHSDTIAQLTTDVSGHTAILATLDTKVADAVAKAVQDLETTGVTIATEDTIGGIKSTPGVANYVSVNSSGAASVDKINVNSLYIPDGDTLILYGGSSGSSSDSTGA